MNTYLVRRLVRFTNGSMVNTIQENYITCKGEQELQANASLGSKKSLLGGCNYEVIMAITEKM